MGDARKDALRVEFDSRIKLEFHGAKVSSDAGLFPYRDLDEAAQLTDSGAAELLDFRTGTNVRHGMTALLRQSVYSRLAGYEDVNDAERLSVDPVMRQIHCNLQGENHVGCSRTPKSSGKCGVRVLSSLRTHPQLATTNRSVPLEVRRDLCQATRS